MSGTALEDRRPVDTIVAGVRAAGPEQQQADGLGRVKDNLVPVRPPVDVVRPVATDRLPPAEEWPEGLRAEVKLDGWRAVGAVLEDHRPVLLSREGNDLGPLFPEVLTALAHCAIGTAVDGELVAWENERISFSALARRRGRDRRKWPPVAYVVFDVLARPGTDLRLRPLSERVAQLEEVVDQAGPPVQQVDSTTSREEALLWYEALQSAGVEGLVLKRPESLYVPGRTRWVKVRHSETLDAELLSVLGSPDRPTTLVVRLPDGKIRRTAQLNAADRVSVGQAVAGRLSVRGPDGRWPLTDTIVIEVAAGTTRHPTLRFVRVRESSSPGD
ncbi:DNA ligase [Streptomyces mirabilis]|uniref:ATP-dependent DNA ligase n=1 Tax=Streptomyces mirabilis TaxID=68239 RepID=UPI0037BB6A65